MIKSGAGRSHEIRKGSWRHGPLKDALVASTAARQGVSYPGYHCIEGVAQACENASCFCPIVYARCGSGCRNGGTLRCTTNVHYGMHDIQRFILQLGTSSQKRSWWECWWQYLVLVNLHVGPRIHGECFPSSSYPPQNWERTVGNRPTEHYANEETFGCAQQL